MRNARAKVSLAQFTKLINPDEPPAKHHLLLIEKLEAIERGELKRLMVFMPPGSAKTTYASVLFVAWYVGRNSRKCVITASHAGDLAKRFGRKVRNIIDTLDFHDVFGIGLKKDSQARGEWEAENDTEYYAIGVDGSVSGRRANLVVIDDPVKGYQAADSAHQRQMTWDWYLADIRARILPSVAIVIIQTRWNEDDLSGRILPDDWRGESGLFTAYDDEVWDVLSLPAEAEANDALGREPGEFLWPDFMGPVFEQHKKSQNARSWSAQYQQRPAPDDGAFFKRDWFNWYTVKPSRLHVYGASDYAVTDGGGDFTEHGVFGLDPDRDIYVLDWWHGQTAPDVWIETQLNLIQEHKPLCWVGEKGTIEKAVQPIYEVRMRERGIYCRMEMLPSLHDKAVRARAFQARASMGKVYLPDNEMGRRLLDQLLRFPAGKNDDAVDVCSLFARAMDELFPATEGKKHDKPKRDAWAEEEVDEVDWQTI